MIICRLHTSLFFILIYINVVFGGSSQKVAGKFLPFPYCGPVSSYITLRHFGIDCTLKEVSDLCNYKIKPVKLSDVYRTLKSFEGIKCSIKTTSPPKIMKYLSVPDTVVLLAIDPNDGESVGHLVVLLPKENKYLLVDYPRIIDNYDLHQLPENIASKCMVVRKASFYSNAKILYIIAIAILTILIGKYQLKKKTCMILIIFCTFSYTGISYGSNVCINQDEEYFDINLGLIESREPNIIKEISIKNETDTPILITEALVSCSSCIKLLQFPNRIETKSQETLKFRIEINKKTGPIEPKVVLKGNAGTYVFAFKGYIRSLWVSDTTLELGNIKADKIIKKEIRLFHAGFPDAKILNVTYSDKFLNLKIKKEEGGNGSIKENGCFSRIALTFDFSKSELGRYDENIIIKTNIEGYSDIKIPVNAYILGNVRLVPSKLLFIRTKNNDRLMRKVKVQFNETFQEITSNIGNIKLISDIIGIEANLINFNKDTKTINIEIALLPNFETTKISHGEIIAKCRQKELFRIPYTVITIIKTTSSFPIENYIIAVKEDNDRLHQALGYCILQPGRGVRRGSWNSGRPTGSLRSDCSNRR